MISDTRTFIISSHDIAARAAETILNLPDSPLHEVIVRPYKGKRSTDQNARLWALHQAAAHHTGYSAEEMHEFCKSRFLGAREVKVGDQAWTIPMSSSKLDVARFTMFMDQVEAFYASELGIML